MEPARPGPPHATHDRDRAMRGAGTLGGIPAARAGRAGEGGPLPGRPEGDPVADGRLLRRAHGEYRVQGSPRGDRGAREEMIHFTDSGGTGAAVLLVHAIGCDHRMWDGLG